MTTNCVTTCPKRISGPVMPDTKLRSRRPSFLSSNIAPEVRATERKKMILRKNARQRLNDFLETTFENVYRKRKSKL